MARTFEQFPTRGWSFLTGHAHVLLAVARDPHVRVKEIAEAAEITERYAYRVLRDLQKAGYVRRDRRGRRNRYRVNPDLALAIRLWKHSQHASCCGLPLAAPVTRSPRRLFANAVRVDFDGGTISNSLVSNNHIYLSSPLGPN
jgi:Sugar-specific transcriptional regulator TrmB